MSDFNGINQFGSIIVNGQKLTFEDFDKDKNGEISTDEYNELLKEVKLDSVEFSSVDSDGDKAISEDEFAIYEQKTLMQDAINNMAKTISTDFAGKSDYLNELNDALKDLINDFAKNYTGEVENMAQDFEAQLPDKYADIKNDILAQDPDTVKSAVLDELYSELITPQTTKGENGENIQGEALPEATAKKIAKELETEANNFIKTYTGNNLEEDLKAHLEEFMNQSDAEKLADAAANFKSGVDSLGAMIDNGADLTNLKEYAKEFLTAALEAGVTIKLGGTTIKTTAAITTALNKFSDGDELKAAIEEVIAGLSTDSLKDNIVAEEALKAQEAAEKAFNEIKGSEYQVNTALIDFSNVQGYFDGSKINTKGKSGHEDKIKEQARQIIENGNIKEQMKQQISDMLSAKGIAFDKIETVFENVYNSSLLQTLDSITSHKTNKAILNKRKKYESDQDIKTIVDNFLNNFNTNIAAAIDEMNQSDTDFDTQDIDYTQAGKDENGNTITDEATGADVSTLYATGQVLTTKKRGADYYMNLAETMIDNMKSQMLKKAKAMCDANGIEFDNNVFNTLFNNAKSVAINAGVSGVTSSGKKVGGIIGGSAGIAAGGTVAIGAATATVATAGITAGATASVLGVSVAASAVPVIGWAAAGIGVLAAGLMSIFGNGHHSSSTLDTRTLLDTFTEQFKASLTAWVDSEKAEEKNV